MAIHLLKLGVGCASVEELAAWQTARRAELTCVEPRADLMHVTRQTPRRPDFGAGSSLYWVIAGGIRARQSIGGVREIRGADGIVRCGLILLGDPVPTEVYPRRAFQGWRYLAHEEAPADANTGAMGIDGTLAPAMRIALLELCLL